MRHSDGSTCSTKDGLLLRAVCETLQKYNWSKAIRGSKWHVKCCSDTISAWYRWFEPARLGGWSCNKRVIQLMGAECVTADSYFVNGGTSRIPLLGGSPTAATVLGLLRAVDALAGAAKGERCMEETVCASAAAFHPVLYWGLREYMWPSWGPWAPGYPVSLGYIAPASMVLKVVLPWPRYPCLGQFPSMVLWVWNKLALMAPALILCGRIPRDSRAITGKAALPSVASSPSSRCFRGGDGRAPWGSTSTPAVPMPCIIPHARGRSRVVHGP